MNGEETLIKIRELDDRRGTITRSGCVKIFMVTGRARVDRINASYCDGSPALPHQAGRNYRLLWGRQSRPSRNGLALEVVTPRSGLSRRKPPGAAALIAAAQAAA